jgi:hypothetical protein
MTADPIAYLKRLRDAGNHNDVVQMIRDRDSVIARYQPAFSRPSSLSPETLAEFLMFENNRHWWGLQRRTDVLVLHIDAIRAMIEELVDPTRPVSERIDSLGEPAEFDREVWSPILLITHPDSFGVWSAISESAMRRLGLWPTGIDGSTTGETYAKVNEMLNVVCSELSTDLWTLDALWWAAEKEHDPTKHFVARTAGQKPARNAQTPGKRTKTLRAAKARAAVVTETFVCQNCWTTKPIRLQSEKSGYCIDCA